MEGDKNFKENGPPNSPPVPRLPSPHEPSTTPHNNGDLTYIPTLAPDENLISFSPVVGGETPHNTNKNILESPSVRNETPFGEAKFDIPASAPSTVDSDAFQTRREENSEPKIVARPTPEDEFVPYVPSSHHRRAVSVDHLVAKVPPSYTSSPTMTRSKLSGGNVDPSRGNIDTAAPIESVKAAVSKFGGIVDWKAHRVQTVERRKFIEQELEKAQEEMPTYKQQCETAEEAKTRVLKELDSTKRLIEELKLNLERAQKEEQQAKQDSELAKLRVEEMEQGIADDSSFAAKAQLEVARARHAAAVSELITVKDELEQLRKDYTLLVTEKEAAEKKAAEAVSTSREVEKSVENLTIELITLKQSLESAHSEHLEAEEHRIHAVMAKEQDTLNWEEELKQAEEEIHRLNEQMLSTKDLKMKLNEATALLHDLKVELAAYMEAKLDEHALKETDQKTRGDIEAAITAAKKELAEVKLEMDKTTEQVNVSKMESASLETELEKEKRELVGIQQRERTASNAFASLGAELNNTESEIALVRLKEIEEKEKMAELHRRLEEEARQADNAKALSRKAREELEKAKLEAEQAKASKMAKESKLRAAEKEIEAARASEKLALAAINALEESESAQKINDQDSPTSGVTLSLEEYYELSKRAHEAEEQANARVAQAISQIEAAKELELESLNKLEEVSREISNRKDELETAQQKAEQATEGKLAVEQELRKWRAGSEQRRKEATDQSVPSNIVTNHDNGKKMVVSVPETSSSLVQRSSPRALAASGNERDMETNQETKATKKKKKSFFPRIFMFLARKKVQSSKKD
ncbi:hypothetical protein CASFOL_021255 [Castilleja foliolosa]|uniref:Paramyosin n=1 Tax=Castilleja foliolosa TaxID=1961234 RepID=A0ABD3CY00_9LAMI